MGGLVGRLSKSCCICALISAVSPPPPPPRGRPRPALIAGRCSLCFPPPPPPLPADSLSLSLSLSLSSPPSLAHPRTVRQKMRDGARKCHGPARVGFVLCFFCRKREYFMRWRTRPPEMVISSQRTTT